MLHRMLIRTAFACASIAFAAFAHAQGYPAQTVRVVVGFPPGGTPDRAAAFIRGEQEKWGRVIREVGIQIQ